MNCVNEYKSYLSASYTIGWYLADMTTWPITCGLTYLSFRGKIRPPSWLQKRIQPFILKYPALSNTIKSRPMLAASMLTVTTPANRLFLPLHIWIMIKYGNDIMKNLEKNPQVSFQTGFSGRIFFFVSTADIKQGSRNFWIKNWSVRISPGFFGSKFLVLIRWYRPRISF